MNSKHNDKKKLSLRERWKLSPRYLRWINFRGSIYWYALWLVVVLVVLLIASMLLTRNNPGLQNIFVAIFTGAISSTIVTILLQVKQDKLQNEKKRSILFDARYNIKVFTIRYSSLVQNTKISWTDKFIQLDKAINFFSEIYTYQASLFDPTEINYLRDIKNNYWFILRMIESQNKDEAKMNDKIGELTGKIAVNIECLKIYWEDLELIPKD